MVVVFVASMLVGVVRQYPTYSNAWANLRTFTGGCGLADDVLVEPDANAGFLTALPGNYGPLGPLGGDKPVGFTPNGVPEHIVAEAIRMTTADSRAPTTTGMRPIEARQPGRQRVDGAAALRPRPRAGSAWRARYVDGPQQQSTLTSAWYQLPRPTTRHPLVVVTAAGTIAGNSVLNGHTDGQTVELEYARPGPDGAPVPAGRLVPVRPRPRAVVAQPAVRPLRDSRRRRRRCGSWPRTGR